MEESCHLFCYLLKYLYVLVGLLFFLLDIVLDILTVVSFYQNGDYVYMAVMIFLLLGSSVLLQVFSWLWYSDCLDELETNVETFAKRHILIKPFHFLQLGVFLRYAGVIEMSTKHLFHRTEREHKPDLNRDLHMLRLFEAFSESAPQLTLMMYRMLQRGELELITGLKLLTSAAAIAFTVAMYHRSMRAFLQEKEKMSWISTGVYFLWNLLLIIPRVSALALFCTVLPCYIIAHFLSLWMLLVLGAWSQKTDYMKSPGWEWLFRATVGIIWYFSWFKVSTGSIKLKAFLYYCVMGFDTLMLLGFWCWKVFEYTGCGSSLYPYIVIPTLLGLHFAGIILKIIYYRWFHPNCDEQKIPKPSEQQNIRQAAAFYDMETDSMEASSEESVTGVLKRGRTMAANFYY
ncbi:XK-related protein 8-like [Chanodichthys erythropterus]|uniref:XK-related protein 8-like n=1 Tax=Chanodichthys erythropterus TaxID=933992 RepID=UPI00351E02ED